MNVLEASLVMAAGGAVGGAVGALLPGGLDRLWPQKVAGSGVLQPGLAGRVVVGAVAAWLSWALYGPLSAKIAIGTAPAGEDTTSYGLTLAALAGAVGIGLGGAKWIQNYVEKVVLKDTTTTALRMAENSALADQVDKLPPLEAAGRVATANQPVA